MSGSNLALIELIGSGVLALGFCFWQIWKTDREIKKDKALAAEKAQQDESE